MTKRATIRTIYDHHSGMEHTLPGGGDIKSTSKALALIRGAKRFSVLLHPPSRERRWPIWSTRIVSYFSRLIERHRRSNSPAPTRLIVGELSVVLYEGSSAWLRQFTDACHFGNPIVQTA